MADPIPLVDGRFVPDPFVPHVMREGAAVRALRHAIRGHHRVVRRLPPAANALAHMYGASLAERAAKRVVNAVEDGIKTVHENHFKRDWRDTRLSLTPAQRQAMNQMYGDAPRVAEPAPAPALAATPPNVRYSTETAPTLAPSPVRYSTDTAPTLAPSPLMAQPYVAPNAANPLVQDATVIPPPNGPPSLSLKSTHPSKPKFGGKSRAVRFAESLRALNAATFSSDRDGSLVNPAGSVFWHTGGSRGQQFQSMYGGPAPHHIDRDLPERVHPLRDSSGAMTQAYQTLARPEPFAVQPRNAARYVPDSGVSELTYQDMAESRKGNLYRTLLTPYLKQDGTAKRVQPSAVVSGLAHAHYGGNLIANSIEAVSARQQGFLRLLVPRNLPPNNPKEFTEVTERVGAQGKTLGELMQVEAKGAPPKPHDHETDRSTRAIQLAQSEHAANVPPGDVNTRVPTAPGLVSNQPILGHGVNKVGGHVEAAGAEPIVSSDKEKPIVQSLLPPEPGTSAQGMAPGGPGAAAFVDPNHPLLLQNNTPTGIAAPASSVAAAQPMNPAQQAAMQPAGAAPAPAAQPPAPAPVSAPGSTPLASAPLQSEESKKRKAGSADAAKCTRSSKHDTALCLLLSKLGKSKSSPLGDIVTAIRAAFAAKDDKDWSESMVVAAHAVVRFSERYPSADKLPSKGSKEWTALARLLRMRAK